MVQYCVVDSCKNSAYGKTSQVCEEGVTWHRLPTDNNLLQKWVRALGVKSIAKSSRICSKHFTPQCFQQIGLGKRRLRSNAIPCALHITSTVVENTGSSKRSDHPLSPNSTGLKDPLIESIELRGTSWNASSAGNGNALEETPTKSSANVIRYPGDVTEEKILRMSPRTVVKSMLMLKKSCHDKDIRIKKLLRSQRCQQKKIRTMEKLLTDLRKRNNCREDLNSVC